ncbi:MAG: type II toxin-antitoxin system VapC family toxin [Candidatus Woesearchaeota archaeon]
MTVLVDSWGWLEYFEDTKVGREIAKYIDSDMTLFISVINLSEVYKQGLLHKNENQANEMVHIMMSRCFLIPVESAIALNAAKINKEKKFGLGDALIHASAKAHNLKLLTGDPHFKREKDVIYVGP